MSFLILFVVIIPLVLMGGWFLLRHGLWYFTWALVCGAELRWLQLEARQDSYGIITAVLMIHAIAAGIGALIQGIRLLLTQFRSQPRPATALIEAEQA